MLEPVIHFEDASASKQLQFIPSQDDINAWIKSALVSRTQQSKAFELSIRVVNEDEMLALNSNYRQQKKTTNVLSFPSDIPDFIELEHILLGDIAICASVVNQEACEQKKTERAHWAHMIIHGCLHLQGYDHIEENQAQEMETLETQLLAKFNFQDPYN